MPKLAELQDEALALGLEIDDENGKNKTKDTLEAEIEAAKAEDAPEEPTEELEEEGAPELEGEEEEEEEGELLPTPAPKAITFSEELAATDKLKPDARMAKIAEMRGLRIVSVDNKGKKKSCVVAKGEATLSLLYDKPARDIVRSLATNGM